MKAERVNGRKPAKDAARMAYSARLAAWANIAAQLIRLAAVVGLLVATVASTAFPKQPLSNLADSPGSRSSLQRQLRAEAAKIDKAEVSPLFAAITDPDNAPILHLDDGQIESCCKLESLGRDGVKAWLLRGLDSDTPPGADELNARLSDRGARVREDVFSHVESIAIEGILSPEQSRAWYKASGTRPRPRMVRHLPPEDAESIDDIRTNVDLADELKYRSSSLDRSGFVLGIMLGTPGVERIYPDGIEHLDPIRKQMAMKDLPKIDLNPSQAELARRLDESTRRALAGWMIRGLDETPLPSRAALAQRLRDSTPVSESLYAHAEAVALQGILTQEQSERCLAIVWNRLGVKALLDPSLCARLKLSRAQREEVKLVLAEKEAVSKRLGELSLDLLASLGLHPEFRAQWEQVNRDALDQRDAFEAAVWDILTPGQSRAMRRILAAGDADRPARKVGSGHR